MDKITQQTHNIVTILVLGWGWIFDQYWPAILSQHGSNIFHNIPILSQRCDHVVNLGESWWIFSGFPIWSQCCHNIKLLNIGTMLSHYLHKHSFVILSLWQSPLWLSRNIFNRHTYFIFNLLNLVLDPFCQLNKDC